MPTKKSYLDIYTDAKTRVQKNTPVSNFGPTGIINNMLHAHSLEVEDIYNVISELYKCLDPSTANGRDLDILGYLVGSTRLSSSTPADYSTTNFFFYLDPGVTTVNALLTSLSLSPDTITRLADYGYINSISDFSTINIPAGITITTKDGSIVYKTMTTTTISDNNSTTEGYTPIIGTLDGPYQNVEANQLISHSLTSDAIFIQIARYIMCSNRYPITSGKSSLTDDDFRYNISLVGKNKGDNEVAVRQAALAIPGVRNILFERGRYGNGSINIIVEGISPLISDSLVEVVRQRVQNLLTGSEKVFVSKPIYRGLELKFDILVGFTNDMNTIKEQVRNATISYINDIPLGGTFVYNQFIENAMGVPGVIDVVVEYIKIGEYDAFNKYLKNQIIVNNTNQKTLYNQKFYTDSGLCSLCTKQG